MKKEVRKMISEVLKARLKKSISSYCKLYLENGFKYTGKITNCDDVYVEVLLDEGNDKGSFKLIKLVDISDADIKQRELEGGDLNE